MINSISFGFVIDSTQFEFPAILCIVGAMILILFGCIVYVAQSLKNVNSSIGFDANNDKLFLCPLCPYLPCLGIFVNSYMIASLKWESFARVIIWFVIGVTLYIFYGSKNSNLNYQKIIQAQEALLDDQKMKQQNKSIQTNQDKP